MTLKVYNTMGRRKVEFAPLETGKVRMYVCGVTVYDQCHIGHGRSAVVFDVMFRYLRHLGFEVTYVRNFTDVDDKIIARANERGISTKELSEQYIDEFYLDMDALNVLRPTIAPKATEHIAQIIDTVRKLEKNGYAYNNKGTVYFPVRKFAPYGKLSGRDIDDMLSGARIEVNEEKKDPLDFVLWKASKPGEPAWDSPWGSGRPGWHIECSAMSSHHLGQPFDIHGGGQDLVFPHHENEIAQSEAAEGVEFARYWLHNGFVQVNHEKMSKSLGNFFTIRDVIEVHPPEVIRFFLLGVHYRNPLDYYDGALQEAHEAVDRVYTAWEALQTNFTAPQNMDESKLTPQQAEILTQLRKQQEQFAEAMDDDFNTPRAIGQLFELVTTINTLCVKGKLKTEPGFAMLLTEAERTFNVMKDVLGFPIREPQAYRQACAEMALAQHNLSLSDIEEKIAARNQARQAKDFAQADALRKELEAIGIFLKDTPAGTIWYAK